MPEAPSKEALESDICLRVIGLFRVVTELKNVSGVGDNPLAIGALAFWFRASLVFGAAGAKP
jgi:hypothetical protein